MQEDRAGLLDTAGDPITVKHQEGDERAADWGAVGGHGLSFQMAHKKALHGEQGQSMLAR